MEESFQEPLAEVRQQSVPAHDAPAPPPHQTFHPKLPASASITQLTTDLLPSFKRLISLLLPVRYPDDYYKRLLVNPDDLWVSRAALWQPSASSRNKSTAQAEQELSSILVGGICARLEPKFVDDGDPNKEAVMILENDLYISTLAVLSPYRGKGLASALLEDVLIEILREKVVKSVYAHVWEANEEALSWYQKRGFVVENVIINGYYRKLRPNGARIVRRKVMVGDMIKGWPEA